MTNYCFFVNRSVLARLARQAKASSNFQSATGSQGLRCVDRSPRAGEGDVMRQAARMMAIHQRNSACGACRSGARRPSAGPGSECSSGCSSCRRQAWPSTAWIDGTTRNTTMTRGRLDAADSSDEGSGGEDSSTNACADRRARPVHAPLQPRPPLFQDRTDQPDQLRDSVNRGRPGRITHLSTFRGEPQLGFKGSAQRSVRHP